MRRKRVSSSQLFLVLTGATTLFALWSAIFATRADWSMRRALKHWDTATKPVPNIVFTGGVSPGQTVDLEVENLGGTLVAGGLIVHVSDELYAGELSMPEKAPPRHVSIPFVVKAWKRQLEPQCLVLIARDAGGRCFDYVDGGKEIKNPRRWLSKQLRELGMQGMIDFPHVTGKEKR